MAPATIKNKSTGIGKKEEIQVKAILIISNLILESDLWAMGIFLYQMLLGYTPFHASSPYLIFLRIKRAKLNVSKQTLYF